LVRSMREEKERKRRGSAAYNVVSIQKEGGKGVGEELKGIYTVERVKRRRHRVQMRGMRRYIQEKKRSVERK